MTDPEGDKEKNLACQEVLKSKIKHDWYQTETHVIITILLKNSLKDKIKINYGERSLSFTSPTPNSDSEYSLELDLFQAIVPAECKYIVTPSKVEIKLKKRDGLRWTKLEGESDSKDVAIKPIPQEVAVASAPPSLPYPSATKKDWDKIEKDIIKQEENEKPEGDAALKKLFEQIYGQGSDEVKKAMVKSFMESGGTVLSTNWNEVKGEKVPVKPPDGMEFKKWDD